MTIKQVKSKTLGQLHGKGQQCGHACPCDSLTKWCGNHDEQKSSIRKDARARGEASRSK